MKLKSKLGTTCSMTMARHSRIICTARLLLLLVLLALPAVVQAEDYTYTTYDGTISITGYTGSGGAVDIPSTINDLPVTRIGDGAFQYNTSLTSVTIPDSVTSIADSQWRDLEGAFSGCTSLTNVMIGNSVTYIGSLAFSGCTSLTSVTIPNSVTSIGSWAFVGCTSLTNVTIGNSVTSVGIYAFSGCTSLTSVTIPSSVTYIGDLAFGGCTSLTAITVDALNSAYSSVDGVLFNKNRTTLIQYPGGKAGSYSIPNSVTSIGSDAFSYCTSLTSVTIPNSVISIEAGAFWDCTSLTSITIPNSVTSIGFYAFSGCTSLTSVTIPNSVTRIDSEAFQGCTSLTSITIPDSVTSIENQTFGGCTSLTSVTIHNRVTYINSEAFQGCTSLTAITVDALNSAYSSVDGVLFNKNQTTLIQYPGGKAGSYSIPNSVTGIGDHAFSGCTRLTNVMIPNSVTSIGHDAFSSCINLTAITVDALNPAFGSVGGVLFNQSRTTLIQYPWGKARSYTIPDSVTSIGGEAFSGCTSLTNVTIPNSVTSIGGGAFRGCTSLTSVTIGNSVTSIEDGTFSACTSLTSVTIPNSVTSIGSAHAESRGAFRGCTSLTNVTIGDSVTYIGPYTFTGCTNLMGVYFQGNAPSVSTVFYGTVYYLPDTTGWGATFAGRPTALWLPEARTSDADFGVRTNQFGFNIGWASDKVVVVEASPDLSNPVWTPVSTNTLTGGSSYFSDPQWTNHPTRFYRLVSPVP